MLVLCGVALSGVGGVDPPVAGAAPRETPAHKITRLRAKAARVQAAIDRMPARVESLVEDYDEVREALARTRADQARTRKQVVEARRQLRAAKRLLGRRLWTIYTGGAPSTLGQLLGADSVHDALVTTKYSGASSFDCSGLTMAAYRSAGVWLPRVSRAQWGAGPHVGLGSLGPGDLVFFAHNTGNPGTIHHVGMYIGGGAMIEAPIPGPGSASPPSAGATTSAPSGRPADPLGRSERILLVRLRGSRSPGSNAPLLVYEHVAGRLRSAPTARRALRAQ